MKDLKACDRFDIRDRLKEILLPTLIVCGKEDLLTPLKYSEYLKENIADSRLKVISQAGHMVMAERPQLLNRALESFIAEIQISIN
jgi:pimeloyl-ACP methyl ester carboxylesterase